MMFPWSEELTENTEVQAESRILELVDGLLAENRELRRQLNRLGTQSSTLAGEISHHLDANGGIDGGILIR